MSAVPRHPIFIPSKGRAERALTASTLDAAGVPFRLVVEPQEADAYAARWGKDRVVVLPFRDRGTVVPARNFIFELARSEGAERHWQVDDNVRGIRELVGGKRVRTDPGAALVAVEEYVDRWNNVAIAGLRSSAFSEDESAGDFRANRQVYCCVLVDCSVPFRWRGARAEDTDFSLQVLAAGLCTLLSNRWSVEKVSTMAMKGGNTDVLYAGDGKLQMARELQRRWPGLGIEVTRRYGIPRMNLAGIWRRFPQRPEPR